MGALRWTEMESAMLRRNFISYCSIGAGVLMQRFASSQERPSYDLIVVGSVPQPWPRQSQPPTKVSKAS